MATVNIGNLTFTHKGDYASGTAYVKNDVVYYSTNGNAYIAKQSTTGNAPTNTTYWNQFAQGSGGIWNAGLSLGSAGQVVKVNSGASALEFGTVSSDFVLLSTDTITSSTANVTRDVFSSTYDSYKVIISGIRPVSSGSSGLYFRWRRGGSTLSDSAYFNHAHQAYYNGSSNGDGPHNENWGTTYGRIYEQDHNTGAEYGGNYEFTIFNTNSTTIVPQVVGLGTMYSSGGYHRHLRFSSWYQGSNKDMNGIHIFFDSPNILDGTIKIYGMK